MAAASRRRFPWLRVIMVTLFVLVSAAAIGFFYVRSKVRQVPEWWAPADGYSEAVVARGEQVENEVITLANRARPAHSSHASSTGEWTLRLTEDEINAWLATRLPKWAANQFPGSFLSRDVGEMHVRIEAGRLRIGARIGSGAGTQSAVGVEVGQSIGIAFEPIREDDGRWRAEIIQSTLGRLPVPLSRGLDVFSQMRGSASIPPDIDRLLHGEGIEVVIRTQKPAGRMTLTDVELRPGELVLRWKIEQ